MTHTDSKPRSSACRAAAPISPGTFPARVMLGRKIPMFGADMLLFAFSEFRTMDRPTQLVRHDEFDTQYLPAGGQLGQDVKLVNQQTPTTEFHDPAAIFVLNVRSMKPGSISIP